MRFIDKLRNIKRWYKVVWKAPSHYQVSLWNKVLYAYRGFNSNEYVWYQLWKNDYHNYISDFIRKKSRDINGEYKLVLDNKLVFEEVFGSHIRVPMTYAIISDGQIHGMNGYQVDETTLSSFLQKQGKVVIKWDNGYEGKGTYIIKALTDTIIEVNGKTLNYIQLTELCTRFGNAIICEYIQQSDFENELYQYATNTIRIVCGKKRGERESKILKAAQRIGNETSKPMDNVSRGAISCEIDLESGILGKCYIAKPSEKDAAQMSGHEAFTVHPETGTIITGKRIPEWNKIKEQILRLTNDFPYLGLVAWDVLLTNDGLCVIEGNASAGCTMFQMGHGIRNEEIGDIYRSYGIIK